MKRYALVGGLAAQQNDETLGRTFEGSMSTSPDSPKRSVVRVLSETAASLGVILGLVFVGAEIRSNTTAIQGATLQGISDQSIDLQMSFATDEHLVRLMPQVISANIVPDDLSEEDRYRVLVAYLSILRVAENRFQQAELGTVPEGGVEQFGGRSVLYATPYLHVLWPTIRDNFRSSFADQLERDYDLLAPVEPGGT